MKDVGPRAAHLGLQQRGPRRDRRRASRRFGVLDDGWKHRQTFGTLTVFRGNADFVFYQRDLCAREVTAGLVVKRRPKHSSSPGGSRYEKQNNIINEIKKNNKNK